MEAGRRGEGLWLWGPCQQLALPVAASGWQLYRSRWRRGRADDMCLLAPLLCRQPQVLHWHQRCTTVLVGCSWCLPAAVLVHGLHAVRLVQPRQTGPPAREVGLIMIRPKRTVRNTLGCIFIPEQLYRAESCPCIVSMLLACASAAHLHPHASVLQQCMAQACVYRPTRTQRPLHDAGRCAGRASSSQDE
jgi:hypothetical protein